MISLFLHWFRQSLQSATDFIANWNVGGETRVETLEQAALLKLVTFARRNRHRRNPLALTRRPYKRARCRSEDRPVLASLGMQSFVDDASTNCGRGDFFLNSVSSPPQPAPLCTDFSEFHVAIADLMAAPATAARRVRDERTTADGVEDTERRWTGTAQEKALDAQRVVQGFLDQIGSPSAVTGDRAGQCDVNDIDLEAVLLDHCGDVADHAGVELPAADIHRNPYATSRRRAAGRYSGPAPRFCYATRRLLRPAAVEWLLDKHPSLRRRLPCIPWLVSGEHLRLALQQGEPVQLGRGPNGLVLLGVLLPERRLVAVKLVPRSVGSTLAVFEEASVLARLTRTGVTAAFHGVGFVDDATRFHKFVLVSDFVGDARTLAVTDVSGLLRCHVARRQVGATPVGIMSAGQWIDLLLRLTASLERIHATGVVINDLKPDNILCRRVDGVWQTTFIDFGSSAFGDYTVNFDWEDCSGDDDDDDDTAATDHCDETATRLHRLMSRHEHLAPELFTHNCCTTKSDVYALGRLLLHVGHVVRLPVVSDIARGCRTRATRMRYSAPEVRRLLQRAADDQRRLNVVTLRTNGHLEADVAC